METVLYFIRYLIAGALSLLAVGGLSVFNDLICRFWFRGGGEDRVEVLAYSCVVAGPVAFSVSFLVFFFGLEFWRTGSTFHLYGFWLAVGLALIGIGVDIFFLPHK